MCGRYARYGLLVLFAGFFSLGLCSAQTYAGFDPPNNPENLDGAQELVIRKTNGESVLAPKLPEQVGFGDVKISADGRRIGWQVLMPNVSYPIPLRLAIFEGDKIELVVDEDICVMAWTFLRGGAQVAYFVETLHFSTGKDAELRDVRSGKLLATYGLKRIEGDIPQDALRKAPRWVREIPDIER
jgi:hypothetical protein